MSSATKKVRNIYDRLRAAYGEQHWWPATSRFEMIVGAILTQNTAWTNVEKAIHNLRGARLLSPDRMRGVPRTHLERLIRPSGYYTIKARRLASFLDFLFNRYNGKIDRLRHRPLGALRRELLTVNGIGPETADSILLYALDRPVFVVDAYTKRIFSRHEFFAEDAPYESVQWFFMKHLPRNRRLYNEYHALIVRLGKEHCRKKPRCAGCPLRHA